MFNAFKPYLLAINTKMLKNIKRILKTKEYLLAKKNIKRIKEKSKTRTYFFKNKQKALFIINT